jgi:hypothetical protein
MTMSDTPQQDDELRQNLEQALLFGTYGGLADSDVHTIPNMDMVMELIAAQSAKAYDWGYKAGALEGKERMVKQYQRDKALAVVEARIDELKYIRWSKRKERIADLLAQKAKLEGDQPQ